MSDERDAYKKLHVLLTNRLGLSYIEADDVACAIEVLIDVRINKAIGEVTDGLKSLSK